MLWLLLFPCKPAYLHSQGVSPQSQHRHQPYAAQHTEGGAPPGGVPAPGGRRAPTPPSPRCDTTPLRAARERAERSAPPNPRHEGRGPGRNGGWGAAFRGTSSPRNPPRLPPLQEIGVMINNTPSASRRGRGGGTTERDSPRSPHPCRRRLGGGGGGQPRAARYRRHLRVGSAPSTRGQTEQEKKKKRGRQSDTAGPGRGSRPPTHATEHPPVSGRENKGEGARSRARGRAAGGHGAGRPRRADAHLGAPGVPQREGGRGDSAGGARRGRGGPAPPDRKSTRLNSSHPH